MTKTLAMSYRMSLVLLFMRTGCPPFMKLLLDLVEPSPGTVILSMCFDPTKPNSSAMHFYLNNLRRCRFFLF